MWLEDILYGALASGVNKPTVIVLNASLVCCILVLLALLILSIQGAPYLVIHVCFLLLLAVCLLVLINWFLNQIGLVKTEDQRKELFPPSPVDVSGSGAATPKED